MSKPFLLRFRTKDISFRLLVKFEPIDRSSQGCDDDEYDIYKWQCKYTGGCHPQIRPFNKRGKALCTTALLKEIWIGPYNP